MAVAVEMDELTKFLSTNLFSAVAVFGIRVVILLSALFNSVELTKLLSFTKSLVLVGIDAIVAKLLSIYV